MSNQYGTKTSQWKAHISCAAAKANQRLGFLRRNLRGSPFSLRELAYTTLVRSSLEYCGSIWDPSSKEEIDMLESVQRRAARWVKGIHGAVSVSALLQDLGWSSLAARRKQQRLCLMYKILHSELSVPMEDVDIRFYTGRHTRNTHQWSLDRLTGRDKHSPLWQATIPRTIPEWNKLDSEVCATDSLDEFKSRLFG